MKQQVKSVAVIGAGTMGAAFVRRMRGGGLEVRVWDPHHENAARLSATGAIVANTVEDAVRDADVVLTMVPTIDAIEATMPKTLPAMRHAAIWLQMSTIGVEGTNRAVALAQRLRPDLVFVDAPVSGSKKPAEEGKLLILASGPADALDALEPIFSVLGQKTMRWNDAGHGSRMKVIMNTWLGILAEGIAETAALAQSIGVALEDVESALKSTALNAPWAISKLEKIERDSFDPDFSLSLATKDLHLAVDAAIHARQHLPLTEALAAQWDRAINAGFGDNDVIGAYRALVENTAAT